MPVFDMLVNRLTNIEENLTQMKAANKNRDEERKGLIFGGHWNLPFNFTKSWRGRYCGGSILVKMELYPDRSARLEDVKQKHPHLHACCDELATTYLVIWFEEKSISEPLWNLQMILERVMAVVMATHKLEDIVEMDLADVPRGLEGLLNSLLNEGLQYKSITGVDVVATKDQRTLSTWGRFLIRYVGYYNLNYDLQLAFEDLLLQDTFCSE
jgi:hypothetical protein